jgi:hypothetical protein
LKTFSASPFEFKRFQKSVQVKGTVKIHLLSNSF